MCCISVCALQTANRSAAAIRQLSLMCDVLAILGSQ
jgi:hypothetical protein